MSGPSNEQNKNSEQRLWDLASHVAQYVTVNELARYWTISRKQIYKQIEQGNLPAIRLGPRSLRIRTSDALQFERQGSNRSTPERQQAAARRSDSVAAASRSASQRRPPFSCRPKDSAARLLVG